MSEYIVKCKEFVGISGKTMMFPEYIDMNREIVRCCDCYYVDEFEGGYWCDRFGGGKEHVSPNGFCAWGARREP